MKASLKFLVLSIAIAACSPAVDDWGLGSSFGVSRGQCFFLNFERNTVAGQVTQCAVDTPLEVRIVRGGDGGWFFSRVNSESSARELVSSNGDLVARGDSSTLAFARASDHWFDSSLFEIRVLEAGRWRQIYSAPSGRGILDVASVDGLTLTVLEDDSVSRRVFRRTIFTDGGFLEPVELGLPRATRFRVTDERGLLVENSDRTLISYVSLDHSDVGKWSEGFDSCSTGGTWYRLFRGGGGTVTVGRAVGSWSDEASVDEEVVGLSCVCSVDRVVLVRRQAGLETVLDWTSRQQSRLDGGIEWAFRMDTTCRK
jgi:hypothetical protein